MSFSEKIRKLRKDKGLSQEQLAEILNVSRQSVSKWESGQSYPEIDKLIVLSDLFGITIDELVKKNIKPTTNLDYEIKNGNELESEGEDEENDEWMYLGGLFIGISIGLITDNLMWGSIGSFLGLGLSYIINGIRRKNN